MGLSTNVLRNASRNRDGTVSGFRFVPAKGKWYLFDPSGIGQVGMVAKVYRIGFAGAGTFRLERCYGRNWSFVELTPCSLPKGTNKPSRGEKSYRRLPVPDDDSVAGQAYKRAKPATETTDPTGA